MRLVVERSASSFSRLREGRIEEFEPAVGAEHGDAFLQRVERLALHADQGIELRFEMVALGDIVEEIGDAALRIGTDDDAQRPPVGQIPDCSLVSIA